MESDEVDAASAAVTNRSSTSAAESAQATSLAFQAARSIGAVEFDRMGVASARAKEVKALGREVSRTTWSCARREVAPGRREADDAASATGPWAVPTEVSGVFIPSCGLKSLVGCFIFPAQLIWPMFIVETSTLVLIRVWISSLYYYETRWPPSLSTLETVVFPPKQYSTAV